jgi:tetratricopeptide (TPR) repeat protein
MTVVNKQSPGLLGSKRVGPSPAQAVPRDRDESSAVRRGSWVVRLLVVMVVVAYLPALRNQFVNWDDDQNFLSNYDYRGLTLSSLGWAWTTYHLGVYQPVAWMILSVEWFLGGMDPRAYHFASLLLHTLNAIVLYYLSLALLRRAWPESTGADRQAARVGSALAAAAFALHPLRVEVVAWASCQPYLPCALFCMLTVLAYLRAADVDGRRHRAWLCIACLLFGLALLSKAAAVGLAAVLLVLDVYPLRRLPANPRRWFGPESRGILWEKVPFVAICAAFVGLAILAKEDAESLAPFQLNWGNWSSRFAQAAYGTCFYLAKTVYPVGLSPFYPLPEETTLAAWPYTICVAAIAGVSVLLFRVRRRWPGLLAAFVSYLIFLSPNLGLIRIGAQIAADRYTYIASIALAVPLAYGLGRLVRPGQPYLRVAGTVAAMGAILLGLISLTWGQCQVWRTSESLWSQVYQSGARRSQEVNMGLGFAFAQKGKWSEAERHYLEAIRVQEVYVSVDPNNSTIQNILAATLSNLGLVYSSGKNDPEKARSILRHAIHHQKLACKLRPRNPIHRRQLATQLLNLTNLYKLLSRTDDAVESLNQARDLLAQLARELPLNPEPNGLLVIVHYEIGLLLEREGRPTEALSYYRQARELRQELDRIHAISKEFTQAIEQRESEIRALHDRPAARPDRRYLNEPRREAPKRLMANG